MITQKITPITAMETWLLAEDLKITGSGLLLLPVDALVTVPEEVDSILNVVTFEVVAVVLDVTDVEIIGFERQDGLGKIRSITTGQS